LVTIDGTLPWIQPAERLSCQWLRKHHSQYGRKLEIQEYHLEAAADEGGVEKKLASGLIKGIEPGLCKTDRFKP